MADKVSNSRLGSAHSRPRGNSKYQWRDWATGEVWEAKRGEDFEVEPNAFLSAARGWARKNGFRVRARVESETNVLFQFLPVPERTR